MVGIGKVNAPIVPCTKALFYEQVQSKFVQDTCDMIKRLQQKAKDEPMRADWAKKCIAQAKKSLPCITPMATFKDNKRSNANAIPSGLNMIDVDHVQNPAELWEAIKTKELPYKVVLVHVTPSSFGLRIIFVHPEGVSISDAQKKMAEACGVVYDEVTKDMARCSFLVPFDYILLINDNILFAENENTAKNDINELPKGNGTEGAQQHDAPRATESGRTDGSKVEAPSSVGGKNKEFPSLFKNIPYAEILKSLLFAMGFDETPTEGERNSALYAVCRHLRFICDFDVDFLCSVLPDWGLPSDEVRATVTSAVNSTRPAMMTSLMTRVLKGLAPQYALASEEYTADWGFVVKPQGLIDEFVKLQPDYLKNPCYLACMACLATLLSPLRGRGMNGEKIALNFMVAISAPQATGKSFMKRVYEQICAPIQKEDERQRKIMRELEKENKRNANKEDYDPKEFEGAIRLLPTNVSNRILVERMDKAKSQHLMICAEEIDSITKAEKSGKWSEKSDIYRLAYDNSLWGQDYASENSYHAVVRLYLNLLFSGTPAAVSRFFNDIENGLITRFLFCDLPDTFGQERPTRLFMDEETRKEVDAQLERIYLAMKSASEDGNEIMLDTRIMVEDVHKYYDEVQRRMYLVNQEDPSRDLARRRYADYAVKMMMIETWLNDGVYTEEIRDRVLGVINYCTEQLLALHGDAINKSLNESTQAHEEAKKRSKKKDCLLNVPNQFTTEEFSEALEQMGLARNSGTTYLCRLLKGGLVRKLRHGVYEKTMTEEQSE